MTKEQITELQGFGCPATNYEELIDWVEKEYGIKIYINFDGEIYTWEVEGNEEYDLIFNFYDYEEEYIISNVFKELCNEDICTYLLNFLKIKNTSISLNLTLREIKFLYNGIWADGWSFRKDNWEIKSNKNFKLLRQMETLKQRGIILENEEEYYIIKEVKNYIKLLKW